ncbi:SIR2 family protein [Streptococcus oralis]|uniref:SIR2 family protein n=1 Tax=Streptococcus oralis TaxID=1303 RepID=UPI0020006058|nr:SIR2 family protein [Streptococcus oralis]
MSNKVDFNDLKNIDYGFNKLSKLNQKPVLFVGSGLSQRYLKSPTWWGLLEKISEKLEIDKSLLEKWTSDNYEEIAERLEAIYFTTLKKESLLESDDIRKPFRELIAQILNEYTVDNSEYEKEISILGGIDYQKLITTNYDSLLEKSVFNIENEEIYIHNDDLFSSETKNKKLYKIHGSIDKPSSMIITKSDYDQFFEKSKYIYSKLLTIFVESPIIFLGYSLSDRNIKDILTTLTVTLSQKDLKQFQERVFIISYSSDDKPEYFLEKEELALLNGLLINVNIFYLRNNYQQLYEVLRDISLQSADLEFAVSKNDVVNHFIMPLYKGQKYPKVVMRELLQNAMDACKVAKRDYNIKISVEEKNGVMFLSILDNGIGMSIAEIKNYYLTIGKSGKREVSNVDDLVGRFGIGALSMFLISDSIFVQTKKSGGSPISFRMYTDPTKESKEVQMDNSNPYFEYDSYTFVRLELKKEYGDELKEKNNTSEFLGYFGLFDVIRGGDISFDVTTNETNFSHCFKKINLDDFICISEKPYKIFMYSKNIDDLKENDLSSLANHILYGDMLVKVIDNDYFNESYWIHSKKSLKSLVKIRNLPLIILEKTKGIDIPLDRRFINLPESIVTQIENEYDRLNLPKYLQELNLICENSIPMPDYVYENPYSVQKMKFSEMLANWYVKSCKVHLPIAYTSVFYISSNKVDEVVSTVFNDKKVIPMKNSHENISDISSSIEGNYIVALSRSYIEDNVINIKNHNVGFRGEAIRNILNRFHFPHEHFKKLKTPSEIKDFVKNHSTELIEFFTSLYENNILWFDDSYKGSSLILECNDYLYISERKLKGNENVEILKDIFQKNIYKNIMLDEGETT